AGAFEHVDIGAVVDVGGREPVALVVPRQEHDGEAGELADAQRRRRYAPRAGDALLAHVHEPRQVVDAGAADDAEDGLGHDGEQRVANSEWRRVVETWRRMRLLTIRYSLFAFALRVFLPPAPGRGRLRWAPRPRARPSSW